MPNPWPPPPKKKRHKAPGTGKDWAPGQSGNPLGNAHPNAIAKRMAKKALEKAAAEHSPRAMALYALQQTGNGKVLVDFYAKIMDGEVPGLEGGGDVEGPTLTERMRAADRLVDLVCVLKIPKPLDDELDEGAGAPQMTAEEAERQHTQAG